MTKIHIDPEIRNRKSDVKITREGQACRKCETPVIKRSHNKPSGAGQAYWFRWWFACPNPRCRTVYMVEAAKVLRVDGQDIDANTGELITTEQEGLC